jgi:hypothetical protein
MSKRYRSWLGCLFLPALLASGPALASPVQVSIDTSLLAGVEALMAFDLIDGGPPANAVAIVDFASDGILGSISIFGDVTGALPGQVTLADSSFFTEYAQLVTLGSIVSFIFDATANVPDPASIPDSFSFFLIDPSTGLSLVSTSDPTGANALLLYGVGDANPLAVYESAEVTVIATAVAEPGGLALLFAGAFALMAVRRSRCPHANGARADR